MCAVSYLNTLPLVWGMLEGEERSLVDLSFAIPSVCADRLAGGEADIGIVPSAELVRQNLGIIRGTGIACSGAVRSILLVSSVPPGRIRTLAADVGSRTSVQLARVLLQRCWGASPAVRTMAPDLTSMLAEADAALIIGDPALRLDPASLGGHVFDLGEVWTEHTGKPMVFAVWAARPGIDVEFWAEPFARSCRHGLAHLEEIAAFAERDRGIPRGLALEYLRENVVLELGRAEYDGLELFLRYVSELPETAHASESQLTRLVP